MVAPRLGERGQRKQSDVPMELRPLLLGVRRLPAGLHWSWRGVVGGAAFVPSCPLGAPGAGLSWPSYKSCAGAWYLDVDLKQVSLFSWDQLLWASSPPPTTTPNLGPISLDRVEARFLNLKSKEFN